jgi:hypothetical protein
MFGLPARHTFTNDFFFYFKRNDASDATVFDAIVFDAREGSFSEYKFFWNSSFVVILNCI